MSDPNWTTDAPEVGKRYRMKAPIGPYGKVVEWEISWDTPDDDGEVWNSFLEQMCVRSVVPITTQL